MKRLLLFAAVAALCLTAPAGAVVYVEGSGEPAFTNTTSNTQWMKWQGSSAYEQYRIEADYYAGSNLVKHENGGMVAPNGSGVFSLGWNSLQEGVNYTICSYGRYWIGGVGSTDTSSCSDAIDTGKRASTTIDLTKPTIAVKIDNGAPYSRTAKLNYHIDYSDNLAFPFPANFICRDVGSDPATACANTTHEFNEACSVALGGMKKVTYFNCDEDLSVHSSVQDGPVTFCAVAADGAIPDNPNSSNQGARADQANLSSRVCDSITIDRSAPQVAVTASATTVLTGDLVTFGVQASDATSGVSGQYAWKWGDNTADGSGAAPTHSFTTAGTYEVKVVTTDAAGNESTATTVITVNQRTTTQPPTTQPPTTQPPTTQPPTTQPPTGTVTPPPTVKEISGGGGTQQTRVAGLEVLAPKRLKLTAKTKALSLALTAEGPGTAAIALVRGGKVHSQGTAPIAAAGTLGYRLSLPRKLKAGAYQLKIAFTPQGAAAATTKTVKVTFTAAKRKRARARRSVLARAASAGHGDARPRSASAKRGGFRVSSAGAPSGVPTGKAPAAPRSREVDLPVQ